MFDHRHQSSPLLPLAAFLSVLLVSASLPSVTHARGIFTHPHPLLSTRPVSPTQAAALPAGVAAAEPAVIPDGPVDESTESLLGDTTKLQLTAETASAVAHVQGVKQGKLSLGLGVAQKFQAWTLKFGKRYSGAAERAKRLLTFAANLAYIEAHNLKHPDEKLKVNEFSDLSFKEFRAAYLTPPSQRFNLLHWLAGNGGKAAPVPAVNGSAAATPNVAASPNGKLGPLAVSAAQLPSSFDWTARRVVGVARSQGAVCGCCYAFASAAAIQSLVAIKYGTNKLYNFAPQQIIDCSSSYGNSGCKGGLARNAYSYVISKGLTYESYYPYRAATQKCKTSSSMPGWYIKKWIYLSSPSETNMQSHLLSQPITVRINVNSQAFKSWGWNIFKGPCSSNSNDLNHAVVIVGYGTENGVAYWIIKNSWGTSWGSNGFGRIQRNAAGVNGAGRCGIALQPTWPSF